MKPQLPQPSELLEELSEKVLGQIDRLSTTAFDSALDEMIEYHRFLLEAYESKAVDGGSFSYAQISDWIESPHQSWLRQYRRLYERAVMRLDQDPDFVSTLARTPMRLLQGIAGNSSPAITDAILDLGITLVGRLENWVTQRTSQKRKFPPNASESASADIELRGSDKTAFKDVVIDVVGAWERLIQFAPSMYGFDELKKLDATQQWKQITKSFPFFRHHLRNTAYFVASATWNEDEIGTLYFQDALVGWTEAFNYALPDSFYGLRRLFLFPALTETDWASAVSQIHHIEGEDSTFPTDPLSTFKVVLDGMHNDTILITAAVLLRWHIEGKQESDISLRIASRLLNRRTTEPSERSESNVADFKSLFMQIMRIEIAGGRFSKTTYGATLDSIAALLDQMTERDVISGRIFTPSTIHGREGLRLSFLTLLLAKWKQDVADALVKQLDLFALNENVMPRGDRTHADLVDFFKEMSDVLLRDQNRLKRSLKYFAPTANIEVAVSQLDHFFRRASETFQKRRTERVKARPIDPAAIERIRERTESVLLDYPAGIHIFQNFKVLRDPHSWSEGLREVSVNKLPKGVFTSPAMQWNWLDLDETIVRAICDRSANLIWNEFWRRPRSIAKAPHGFASRRFWRQLRHLAKQVGPRPSLLLSNSDQAEQVLGWTHRLRSSQGLNVTVRPRSERSVRYLASVEGIDVYGGQLPDGPFLFSGNALTSVTYHAVDAMNRIVSFYAVGDEDPWNFSLVARFSQQIAWSRDPIFEVKFMV